MVSVAALACPSGIKDAEGKEIRFVRVRKEEAGQHESYMLCYAFRRTAVKRSKYGASALFVLSIMHRVQEINNYRNNFLLTIGPFAN